MDLESEAFVNHYDELPFWSALAGRLLLEHVPLPSAGAVLDLGCGTGFPSIELAERCGPGVSVIGVDLWEAALARGRDKATAWGCRNVRFERADAARLPFADGTFDLVISCLGLNNFADRGAAFAEARRVLAPTGRLALATNLSDQFDSFYKGFRTWLEERGDEAALDRLASHIRSRCSREDLELLGRQAGLVIARFMTCNEVLRFASAEALFRHHFIRLAFAPAWFAVVSDLEPSEMERELGQHLARATDGELRLHVPLAYVEFVPRLLEGPSA